jgi:hypothetical protein
MSVFSLEIWVEYWGFCNLIRRVQEESTVLGYAPKGRGFSSGSVVCGTLCINVQFVMRGCEQWDISHWIRGALLTSLTLFISL